MTDVVFVEGEYTVKYSYTQVLFQPPRPSIDLIQAASQVYLFSSTYTMHSDLRGH